MLNLGLFVVILHKYQTVFLQYYVNLGDMLNIFLKNLNIHDIYNARTLLQKIKVVDESSSLPSLLLIAHKDDMPKQKRSFSFRGEKQ